MDVDKSLWLSVNTSLSSYIPSLFLQSKSNQTALLSKRCIILLRPTLANNVIISSDYASRSPSSIDMCVQDGFEQPTTKHSLARYLMSCLVSVIILVELNVSSMKMGIPAKVVKDTQQQINPPLEVVPGNCVAVIFWLYLSVLII